MNIYQYVAVNNPQGAREIVESYGIPANRKVLSKQLASVVAKNGQEALDKVACIHPDLPLFQKIIDDFKEKIKKDCEDKTSSNFSNLDGQAIKSEIASLKDSVSVPKQESNHKTELMIIGGIIVIGLAIVFKQN